ncbi:MAG: DUF357 domain-containing protein [Candidatus Diapherotrites archaeon]|nr:DUF357 domain-containing protein [Candidatus Diapherotrites archaeon]
MADELKKKVEKYAALTEKALGKIKMMRNLSAEQAAIADDFLQMARNYFSDAKHFMQKKDLLTALAAFSYAHAWLDAGVRAKLFDARGDDRLFTLPK